MAAIRFDLTSCQKDGTLHVVLPRCMDDKHTEIAHWVSCGKSQMLREYLVGLGWTPPEGLKAAVKKELLVIADRIEKGELPKEKP